MPHLEISVAMACLDARITMAPFDASSLVYPASFQHQNSLVSMSPTVNMATCDVVAMGSRDDLRSVCREFR